MGLPTGELTKGSWEGSVVGRTYFESHNFPKICKIFFTRWNIFLGRSGRCVGKVWFYKPTPWVSERKVGRLHPFCWQPLKPSIDTCVRWMLSCWRFSNWNISTKVLYFVNTVLLSSNHRLDFLCLLVDLLASATFCLVLVYQKTIDAQANIIICTRRSVVSISIWSGDFGGSSVWGWYYPLLGALGGPALYSELPAQGLLWSWGYSALQVDGWKGSYRELYGWGWSGDSWAHQTLPSGLLPSPMGGPDAPPYWKLLQCNEWLLLWWMDGWGLCLTTTSFNI